MSRKHTLDKTERTVYSIMTADQHPMVAFVTHKVDGAVWISVTTYDAEVNTVTSSIFSREQMGTLLAWSKNLAEHVEQLLTDNAK